ncbi:MAG: SDR family NAD(P)-dependent oxidoreductase [Planctomycetes bacterium]|nr:SDR family NAD(P)-dependent oxidoreductase [Planctomycetota bacterium]
MATSKKAVVIGASSGIGREIARCLAAAGWRVAVAGRRKELLDQVAAEFPESVLTAVVDVDDTAAVPARLDAVTARLEGVDLVVISAGCGFLNPRLEAEPEQRTVATNVFGFTAVAAWAYNRLARQGGGQLAAITSVGGLLGEAAAPAYAASKAYQILYLDGLRKRARNEKSGVIITELRPGSVDTAMMQGEGHFWISSARDAATLACRAMAGKRPRQYISRRWALIGLVARMLSLFS